MTNKKKTVGVRDPEALETLRGCISQRSGVEASEAKTVELAVSVALKGLGADSDSAIYSTAALQKIMRERTFQATVDNLKLALSYFEPDFDVIADAETGSIEIHRVKEGVDQTVIIRGGQQVSAPAGVN